MVTLSVFSSKREPAAGVINNCLRLWLGVQLVSYRYPGNKGYAFLFPRVGLGSCCPGFQEQRSITYVYMYNSALLQVNRIKLFDLFIFTD